LAGCNSRAGEVEFITEPVTRGSVARNINVTGTVNPVAMVNVGAQVSGTLVSVLVDFNDRVKAGQILAKIDPLPYKAQVDQSESALRSAKAARASAEAKARRDQELFARGFVSAAAVDNSRYDSETAQAKVSEAEAAVRRDRANLAYTTIRSPISGVVLSRQVSVGQTVASAFQTPVLFVLAEDLGKMRIEASVPESDIGEIQEGQAADFTVDAFPGQSYKGVVRQVRNNFATVQGVVTYTVLIDAPSDQGMLRPGMTANVRIAVVERTNVLRIPAAALRYEPSSGLHKTTARAALKNGQRQLWRLAGGKVIATPVQIGLSDGKWTEVASGLSETDRVVVAEKAQEN
jgi:HlyD family secretion protein